MANVLADEIVLTDEKTDKNQWDAFRQLSLRPGGFKERRVEIWSKLLNVSSEEQKTTSDVLMSLQKGQEESVRHPDEHQIQLDTDRSFVMYPNHDDDDRQNLQADLHLLLTAIFRKRPKLSYFQGYHDIMTVLFLTLPPELQFPCAEKLSLQRLRDSMGATLEPILGLLRIMGNLVRLADPVYADLLDRHSRLPYFALSNLLTLFAHDVPTLPLIQHVFDYLLCRPPIMSVYLATAITLSRKSEVVRLDEEGDDGMIHSLLGALPSITDDDVSKEGPLSMSFEDRGLSSQSTEDNAERLSVSDAELNQLHRTNSQRSKEEDLLSEHSEVDNADELNVSNLYTSSISPNNESLPSDPLNRSMMTGQIHDEGADPVEQTSSSSTPQDWSPNEEDAPAQETGENCKRMTFVLTSLLSKADSLYKDYPPNHPGLKLSSIMGPQSVVFTWSQEASNLPNEDSAEMIVEHQQHVVYPYAEEEPVKEVDTSRRRPGSFKKPRRLTTMALTGRRTIVFSAVLVLGAAMVIYNSRNGAQRDTRHNWAMKDLKTLGGWLLGVMIGLGDRIYV